MQGILSWYLIQHILALFFFTAFAILVVFELLSKIIPWVTDVLFVLSNFLSFCFSSVTY